MASRPLPNTSDEGDVLWKQEGVLPFGIYQVGIIDTGILPVYPEAGLAISIFYLSIQFHN